jgi:hypothetical protein
MVWIEMCNSMGMDTLVNVDNVTFIEKLKNGKACINFLGGGDCVLSYAGFENVAETIEKVVGGE